MIQINAIGDDCPLPVIKTKQALSKITSGQLEVLVGNEIAVKNIQKYVHSVGCLFQFDPVGDYFRILIEKPENLRYQDTKNDTDLQEYTLNSQKTVVVLSSDTMGYGDDELGHILMKGFVFALTQLDELPDTILLYNSGAKLSVSEAATLNDLLALEKAGVKIMTCGTCLNHYGIADQLGVGEVTNMYSILDEMRHAGQILRP